jgi:signal transduction histidine kinase
LTPPSNSYRPGGRTASDPARTGDAGSERAVRRHMVRHAGAIALLMRHSANVVVTIAVLLLSPAAAPAGETLLGILGIWAVYRLATRIQSGSYIAIDYAFTMAGCFAIPTLVSDKHFYTANSAPIAIVGTAVISFAVSLPPRVSLPMTAGIAIAYAVGSAQVVGWTHVGEIFNLYYFALQWITSATIRLMVLRIADAVDAARARRQAAEIAEQVSDAVRDYDREQLRLLHDTVASTLLMVGQGAALPQDRLAARARSDLLLLSQRPTVTERPGSSELVDELRRAAQHLRAPQHWKGMDRLWMDAHIARHVVAGAREAMNNIDRHAGASSVVIDVGARRVTITDDGCGFDTATPNGGTGIAESIIARMERVGGSATITSSPSHGTTVELCWPARQKLAESERDIVDTDRLVARTQIGYGLALTAYAVANLAALTAQSAAHVPHPASQIILALISGAATVAAVPTILTRFSVPLWLAGLILLATGITQTASLPAIDVGTQAQWSQGAMGWCLLPHLLRLPVSRAAALLVTFWVIPASYALVRDPSASTALNIGLGTASILLVQLCALFFNDLIRDGAAKAYSETAARMKSVARERITDAVHSEYRRRYAGMLANIYPLLRALADGRPVDTALRRTAQTQTHQLRTLFDQSATFHHPLLRTLRPAIDAAEGSGIDISVHVEGHLPDMTADEAARIATPLVRALEAAPTSARIAVTSDQCGIAASIVCRGLANPIRAAENRALQESDVEITTAGDTMWLTVRGQTQKGPRCNGGAVTQCP